MSWSWKYLRTDGSAADAPDHLVRAGSGFPSQSDAESWIGETWRELREAGVAAVALYEVERLVYGPMSLQDD